MDDKQQILSLSKYVFNISLVMTLIVLVLSICFYSVFNIEFSQYLYKDAEKDLERPAQEITSLNNNIFSLCQKLYWSNTFSELLSKDVEMSQEIVALNYLREYRIFYPFIHSIVFYSPVSRKFYTHTDFASNSIMEYDDFFDIEIIRMIRSGTELPIRDFVPIVRVFKHKTRGKKDFDISSDNVFTYVYSDYDTLNPDRDRFVIMNIDAKYISSILNSYSSSSMLSFMNISGEQQTFIMQQDGAVICGNVMNGTLTEVDPFVETVFNSESTNGSFQYNIEGVPSLVVYRTLELADWKLVRIIPISSINRRLEDVRNRFFVILISMLITSIAVSWLVSRWMYRPVAKMSSNLLLLKKENEIYSTSYERKILADILRGSIGFDEEENLKVINKLGLHRVNNREIIMLIFAMYMPSTQDTTTKETCMMNQISMLIPLIRSIVCPDGNAALDAVTEEGYTLVLYMDKQSAEDISPLLKKLTDLQMQPECILSLNVGISEMGRSMYDLPVMFSQSQYALKYCYYKGNSSISKYSDVKMLNKNEPDIREHEKNLLKAVNAGEKENATACVGRIIDIISKHTYENYVLSVTRLAYSLKNSITYIEAVDTASRLLDKIKKNPSCFIDIYHLERSLISELSLVCDATIEQKLARHKDMILDAVEYINTNYHNYDMGLNRIAELFHLTPSYLENLFVANMGTTIPELIKRRRIEKACDLLLNTDLSIDEVSNQIGYPSQSKSSFYKLFKRVTGKTPAEYRKSRGDQVCESIV